MFTETAGREDTPLGRGVRGTRILRRGRAIAVTAAICVMVASCGARVVPLSADQQLEAGGIPQAFGSATAGPDGPDLPAPAAGPRFPSDPNAPPVPIARNCTPADTGREAGVTKATIKLGLISSIHGPLPGQFDSAVEATDSYFRMINDLGGICGRKVQLLIRDDQGNPDTNDNLAFELATEDKIFAFVGSVAAPYDAGIAKASKKYRIPDIGFPLSSARSKSPYTYGVPGQINDRIIGTGASGADYLNHRFGIKQVAMFWLDESDVSRLNAWGFEAAMQKVTGGGIKICYEQPTTVIDSSFTGYVINMQSACRPEDGPIGVYTTMENNSNIKLALAMRDQDFKPTVFVPTLASYLQSFITQAQGSTEGAYIALPQIPFEHVQVPQSSWSKGTHELARYLQMLGRYHPRHAEPGSFGAPGWGSAALFTEAAVACGAVLTRTCLLERIESIESFSANGMLSPTRPRDHLIFTIETLVQVKGNRFVEVPHPGITGPPGLPDFWMTSSRLFDWWDYYCANKRQFPNTAEKDRYIRC